MDDHRRISPNYIGKPHPLPTDRVVYLIELKPARALAPTFSSRTCRTLFLTAYASTENQENDHQRLGEGETAAAPTAASSDRQYVGPLPY